LTELVTGAGWISNLQKEEAEWVYDPGYGYQWVDPQIQAYRNYQQQIYQQPLSARRSYNNPNCGGDLYCGTGSAVGTGGYSGYGGTAVATRTATARGGGYSGGSSSDCDWSSGACSTK